MTVVAIDGPAGSGKSTIASALAQRLGVAHVDTGAYYRAAALAVLRAGANPDDTAAVLAVVEDAHITREGTHTLLDGQDVEAEIRGPDVTRIVSAVSGQPNVRRHLVRLQRAAVGAEGAVVEGRDAGTVVVPEADLKVWLTAAAEERARRRAAQVGTPDANAVAAHAADIERRDAQDAEQMERAADAVEIDTTDRSVDTIVSDIVERLAAVAPRP